MLKNIGYSKMEIDLKQIRFINGLNQQQMADILGVTKQQISNIESGKSKLTAKNYFILEQKFDINNVKPISKIKVNEVQKNTTNCTDCYEIPYWEVLPEEAKLSEISSIHVDTELVENHWNRKLENLRIIPMQGDCLSGYYYPCSNRDILIIDINSNIPTREGLYVYTAHNNTMLFVAKLSQSIDGTITVEKFEKNGEIITKSVSPETQNEVDFRVIGRVVKNVSLTL